jgi:hypothetical protein
MTSTDTSATTSLPVLRGGRGGSPQLPPVWSPRPE